MRALARFTEAELMDGEGAALDPRASYIKKSYAGHVDRWSRAGAAAPVPSTTSLGTGKTMKKQSPPGGNERLKRSEKKIAPFSTTSYCSSAWGKTLAKPRQNVVGISDGAYEKL